MDVIVLVAIVLGLFLGAFLTGRRFGPLGLGLGAGAILSPLWAKSVTNVVASDIKTSLPLDAMIAALLILLPAIFILLHGPKIHGTVVKIIHSVGFTLLSIALAITPLQPFIIVGGSGKIVYDIAIQYRPLIITVGLLLALIDLTSIKSARHSTSSGKH
jgi:hypothetical protein